MQLLILFLEFFKIGLFSVGGGLATLPFLYDLADKYPWFSVAQIPDMIAISESTPGPLGVNMATHVGFQCGGVLGGVIATAGLATLLLLLSLSFRNFWNASVKAHWWKTLFMVCVPLLWGSLPPQALELSFFLYLIKKRGTAPLLNGAVCSSGESGYCSLSSSLPRKWKKVHPIVLILIGAAVGIVFQMA